MGWLHLRFAQRRLLGRTKRIAVARKKVINLFALIFDGRLKMCNFARIKLVAVLVVV